MADQFTLSRRVVLFAPLVLAACKNAASILEISGATMGTTYSVVAVDHGQSLSKQDVSAAVEAALARVNSQMSNWDAGSEISRFNNALSTESVTVSAEFADVVAAAGRVNTASEGQFDITLGPLIELWGFGAETTDGRLPDERAIARAMGESGQGAPIEAGPGSLRKTESKTRIYLSGIGKGHGVDRVAQALSDLGLTDYMVEIGGDLFTAGLNPDGLPWRIGIEKPNVALGGIERVAKISDLGMATSGDYRNYFEEDGVRYSHILDARTGRPVTHKTASATVLAENAMMADAWATAMLGLGRERGLEIAEAHDLAVLFLERDSQASDAGFTAIPSARFAALQS